MPKRKPFPKFILDTKPMDWRYVDYNYLSHKVQEIGIKSFRQYRAFLRDYHPGGFPSRPELVYKNEWISWNEFLRTDNCYLADHPEAVREKDLIPYWEAVNLIHPMNFVTLDEFLKAFDAGDIPKGIPRRPDMRYEDFHKEGGWSEFLGKQVKHKVQAAQNTLPLLAICRNEQQSSNVLTLVMSKQGPADLMERLRKMPHIKALRVFKWEDELGEQVYGLLNYYGSQQSDNSWMFSSVDQIMFELSSLLEFFNG